MKRLAVALAAVAALTAVGGRAAAQPRSMDPDELAAMSSGEPPQVILLTFGVGARIFEKFGHAAICLSFRSSTEEPVCFNYGVTDFDAGTSLVWGFLRSHQKFWVEPERWSSLIEFYTSEDRDIWEQVLPLEPDQARAIEARLRHDLQEANRYYIYDHFFDNCTTRLRDMIDRATGGKLHAGGDVPYPLTFREIGHRGLAQLPALIGISDFVLGRQLDDTPSLWVAMFHPDVLREQVALRLGATPRLLYRRQGRPFPTSGSTGRLPMFLIALVFALPLLVATWRRRWRRAALTWAALYLAGWGLVLWALVVISSIPGVRWNEAVFVLVPFDAVLPFLSESRARTYARVRVAILLLVSLLCAVGVFHQPLWIPILTAIMPLAIVAFDLPHPLLRRRETARA